MPYTYVPSASDALKHDYVGFTFEDAVDLDPSMYDPKFIDAKPFLKPVQDEVLALWQNALEGAPALEVKNNTGSTITKGSLVYILGIDGSTPTIAKALANDFNRAPSYVLTADIADGATGNVFQFAHVSGFDTSAKAIGDEVYLSYSVAGGIAYDFNASFKVITVGRVETVDATTGTIFFYCGAKIDTSITPYALQVKNYTGSSIPAGPVAIVKWIETDFTFSIAPAIGVKADLIIGTACANGASMQGYLLKTFGSTLDTSLATLGDKVYLNLDGTIGLTETKQVIGYVKTPAVSGVIKGFIQKPRDSWQGESLSAPSTPLSGDMYYDQSVNHVYIYANAGWIQLD